MKYFRKHGDFLVPTGLRKASRDLYIFMVTHSATVYKFKTITGRIVARVLSMDGRPLKNVSWIHFSRLKERDLVYKDGLQFKAQAYKVSKVIVKHKRLNSGKVKSTKRSKG